MNTFDTNVLVYLLLRDSSKADQAAALVEQGGVISVQVLNEIANASRRKQLLTWPEVREFLARLQRLLTVRPVSLGTHQLGLGLLERYQLSLYDSMIVASALLAGSEVLWSEDMQHGLVVEGRLTIRNPFVQA